MKRSLEETDLELLRVENARLKDQLSLCTLERNVFQKRREFVQSEQDLTIERYKQKLAQVENEKWMLVKECERLGGQLIGQRKLWSATAPSQSATSSIQCGNMHSKCDTPFLEVGSKKEINPSINVQKVEKKVSEQ